VAFTLDTKRKQRFDFMRCLYDRTEGSEMGLVYVEEIAEQIGLPELDTEIIALFLADEGLIRVRMRNIISITHIGIDEVETALANPDKATTHFPPLNASAEHAIAAVPPLTPRPAMPELVRDPRPVPEPPLNLPLQPLPPPLTAKAGDDLELKSICEAIGLDPRAVTGEAAIPTPAPDVSDEVHKMLERAQAAAAAPAVPTPPAPFPISAPPRTRSATARVLKPQATPAQKASEMADLLSSLKLRLLKIRLEPDDMGEAQAEIATAIAQLLSPRPKQPIIAASLATLLSLFEGAHSASITGDVKKSLAKISDFLDQL
jgi:hypothetical protein